MSTPNTSIEVVPNEARRAFFKNRGLLRLVEAFDDDLGLRRLFFHRLIEVFGGPGADHAPQYTRTLTTTSLISVPKDTQKRAIGGMIASPDPNPIRDFLRVHSTILGHFEGKHVELSRSMERSIDKAREFGLIQGTITLEMCLLKGHSHFTFSEQQSGQCPICSKPMKSVEFLRVDPMFFRAWENGVLIELWLYSVLARNKIEVEPSTLVRNQHVQLAEIDLMVKPKSGGRLIIEASGSLSDPSNDCKHAIGNSKLLGTDCRACVVSSLPVAPAFAAGFKGLVTVLDNAEGDADFIQKLLNVVQ